MSEFLKLLKISPDLPSRVVLKYLKYESGEHELARVPHKAFIACTSRTGSTLLQNCLERYELNAQEFFNPEVAAKQAAELGLAKTTRQYANYLARAASPNGRFVAKGSYPAFLFLYFMNEVPTIKERWKVVFLRRRNLVRQAISMNIVSVTQQWNSDMRPRVKVKAEDYSFDGLVKQMDVIYSENQIWERIFGLLDIEPLRVFYEDFIADIAGVTQSVAGFMGVDVASFPGASKHEPRLKPQSTEINDEWERRFRDDLAKKIADLGIA